MKRKLEFAGVRYEKLPPQEDDDFMIEDDSEESDEWYEWLYFIATYDEELIKGIIIYLCTPADMKITIRTDDDRF